MASSWGVICLALVLQAPPPNSARQRAPDLSSDRQAIVQREAAQLKALADRLKAEGRVLESAQILERVEPPPADGASRFVPLPAVVQASSPNLRSIPAAGGSTGTAPNDLESIRTAAAKSLFELAQRALSEEPRQYALADGLLRSVLDRQPDHAEARRLLGYVPHNGGWATPYAVNNLRGGKVLHPVYGWVFQDWVPHLDRGELPIPKGRVAQRVEWHPTAVADEWHQDWAHPWTIDTEHFRILSNVPLAEVISFSRELEAFHDVFFSVAADLIGEKLPLAQRFRSPKMTGEPANRSHTVYYFQNKQEYVDKLEPTQGQSIAQSLGIYIPPTRGNRAPAYFFRDVGGQLPVTATLYHEVSHQLLFETAGPNHFRQNSGQYWVFEGFGTYFETVTPKPDGALEVGGLIGRRIEEARKNVLDRRAYIPLDQFVAMGQREFNDEERIYLHYQEAMALTVFFMQAEQGRYREGFLDYLKDAYRGRLKRTSGLSLEARLGVPFAELDREFLAYLKQAP
jgi:hypothetical protein